MKLFTIGEIAKQVNVPAHTITFWKNSFAEYIYFNEVQAGRMYYPAEAIEVFKIIKYLIHDEGMRIRAIKKNILTKKLKASKQPFSLKQRRMSALGINNRKTVTQYDLQGKKIATFNSVKEAGSLTNLYSGSIAKCCRGDINKYKNFIWKYSI